MARHWRCTVGLREQAREDAAVDARQRLEIVERDALVDLVDRVVDRAELDHFVAHLRDEATVGGPAGARELRHDPRLRAHGLGDDVDEPAAGGEVGLPEDGNSSA